MTLKCVNYKPHSGASIAASSAIETCRFRVNFFSCHWKRHWSCISAITSCSFQVSQKLLTLVTRDENHLLFHWSNVERTPDLIPADKRELAREHSRSSSLLVCIRPWSFSCTHCLLTFSHSHCFTSTCRVFISITAWVTHKRLKMSGWNV